MNQEQKTYWRLGAATWGVLVLTLLLAIWSYYGGLANLVERWNAEEEYNHGYFLPLVTLVFLWQRGAILKTLDLPPSWHGPVLVVTALLMLTIGELSAIYLLIHYSFVLLLMGLSLAVLGWSGTRYTFVPIGILVFAIPIPYFLEATVTSKLQLISSTLGVALIRLFSVPVFREGNLIDLGVFKLEVIEACSGLTYLYPLLGFGCICAYLYAGSPWKRALLIFSTLPIAILLNSFRIGMIGILVKYFGGDQARGFLHDFEGFAVFMVCVAILFAEMWGLTLVGRDRRPFGEVFGLKFEADTAAGKAETRFRRPPKPLIICALSVAVSASLIPSLNARTEVRPSRSYFSSFARTIGEWRSHPGTLDEATLKTLGLTDYLLSDFSNAAGESVNFYVAYYESQRKGVSPHSPAVCLPGGGWQIMDFQRKTFSSLAHKENIFEFNRVVINKGKSKQLVYYWFEERGRILADEYTVKWYLFRDALLDNRTDGALVRVTTPIIDGEADEVADNRLTDFISGVLPILPEFVPH
ncbi:VPLPA-CTERM-specific exosortase XrtD [Methylococcus sp. EFPC2]|uniref:VPLPA-CTERM-specific exosortase XrtD n=1 Tax=Methylococcus sp. EFPC2 TaxID=2812648 RepID=UPI001F072B0C|nr:VPLPA-CTERM-specific exosortase XrtD [Methylococcus sp. EFPC2]